MKIYFFRHAQKAMDFSSDPGLTAEGHAQAQKITEKVFKKELPKPTLLWTSPKKRACSTFQPLAKELGLPLHLEEALLEQRSDESLSDFTKRIRNLCNKASAKSGEVLFICSHYDWVLEAMQVIPCIDNASENSELSHWVPAQYAGFDIDSDGLFKLLEIKKVML